MKRIKKFIEDFKEFLAGSTFLDVAIGLLIAGAVKDVANTFTSSFVSPIITRILEVLGVNSKMTDATSIFGIEFYIGTFITALITFVIIMFVAFMILRGYARFKEKFDQDKNAEQQDTLSTEQQLLTEIRDLLAAQKNQE
ncbi:MscL family protein [Mollicutes bacterium LVI A0039]|nr:MscL family protein [Mollicutes bacterium LVI A0039]